MQVITKQYTWYDNSLTAIGGHRPDTSIMGFRKRGVSITTKEPARFATVASQTTVGRPIHLVYSGVEGLQA